jgi:hypothetical protein
MRHLRYVALAVVGLLLGFVARQLWPAPAAPAPASLIGPTAARPVTPESRRLVERVAARRAAEPVAPPSQQATLQFHPRAAEEWQGMRVMKNQPRCETSATCGLATACGEGGQCGPCRNDGQCLSGERCALDHCVPAAPVACRSMHDCKSGELCVLSGYTSDARGNAGMTARCIGQDGGSDAPPEVIPAPPPDAPARTDFGDFTPPQALLDSL